MRTGIRWLLAMKAACGETLYEHTITNNPATFTTEVAKKLKGFTIPFTPVQSGSGDPTPDNVRAITGWTGLNIYQSGEDTSNPETTAVSWSTEAGTVYGGTFDALSGVLSITHHGVIASSLEWSNSSQAASGIFMSSVPYDRSNKEKNIICDQYKTLNASSTMASMEDNSIKGNVNTPTRVYVRDGRYTDAADWLAENGSMMIVYELATPQTVQLDPVTVTALVGENNIWTNTNGDNTIKYLSKTQPVSLGGGLGGGFGSGTETPSEPEEPSEEPGE